MHSFRRFKFFPILGDLRFWLMAAVFVAIALLHYPQIIHGPDAPYSLVGMGRHSFDRILLLLPIGYASFVFGLRGGIVSVATAAAIMLPRDFLFSNWPVDALYESAGILFVGVVINLWFYMHRKDAGKTALLSQELQYYTNAIVNAQEDERRRISRDLHDSVAQTLVASLRQLDNFVHQKPDLSGTDNQSLGNLQKQIREALKDIRIISRDLRPSILDDLGLLPSIEWLCEQVNKDYSIVAKLTVSGTERKLSREAELILFRIIQEALRNIGKHSKATQADIYVEFYDKRVVVKIADNGVGFDIPPNLGALPQTGKLGLAGIQERVRLLGGTVRIESAPGKGTRITAEAPV
jgi:two-component system sensor histidine kinase DegS